MKKKQLKLFNNDCLKTLCEWPDNSVDLVYLDPPFFTQKNHKLTTKDGRSEFSFSDRWEDIEQYLEFLKVRLAQCRRVLKPTGSLFFHCDSTASHYIKVMLDSVFGYEHFQSEVIWSYKRWSNAKKGLLSQHQNILFYSKTTDFKFHTFKTDYSSTTNVDQIVQMRTRDNRGKAVYKKDQRGRVELASAKPGVPIGDVWDIPFLNPKARERVDYPTQKPILLLERIIALTTDEGDVVMDPFCGSGTTLVAAKLMNREAIGMDISTEALKLAKARLKNPVKTDSQLLKKGPLAYLKNEIEVLNIVKSLGGTVVQRNKGIDGLLTVNQQLVPFKVVMNASDLVAESRKIMKASLKNRFLRQGLCCQFEITDEIRKEFASSPEIILFRSIEELQNQV